ncbi:lysophospholipase [Microbulbifer harenosus]|uniref:Alpha/beta hydrolase n=1 Tax=Microbulbifer harenosus TaxID=2576840 RepID=A0ABY2UH34_9GAMM|nr:MULTISPECIES: alpha/beta hydrolase [Microbulbifer]QIL88762.1 alpha/beta fold hydrolase [Microbulbifer sp. SH-1]TLM76252.1 alpha/beta hydrolase [Microbulbifer harenosus]
MYFESREIRLHYRRWWVECALGVVVVSHGLGEHSGRYRRLAGELNARGYSVYVLDHYGHGQSPGRRGDVGDFFDYSRDLCRFVRLVRHENPGLSLHLLGHSMGGVIACASVVYPMDDCAVESLVLSAPAFVGANEPSGVEFGLLKLLGHICPGLPLSNRLQTQWISRDPDIVEAYRGDELVHGRITPRWYAGYRRVREQLLAQPEALKIPCLLLLPEQDMLVDVSASHRWFNGLSGSVHRLCRFPGAYHEIFNEPEDGDKALDLLVGHLNALSRSPSPALRDAVSP